MIPKLTVCTSLAISADDNHDDMYMPTLYHDIMQLLQHKAVLLQPSNTHVM